MRNSFLACISKNSIVVPLGKESINLIMEKEVIKTKTLKGCSRESKAIQYYKLDGGWKTFDSTITCS
jgi:hypothetical protein